ncbi:MAG: enoyl-CoA hydratase/isomerase family protein [Marinobacter sp.]|uniref:enoyl-CoA hydratase/isomerase family protein n=1 Tax=Marinobacter sp. TaxID=50741 RepID=UPI003297300E
MMSTTSVVESDSELLVEKRDGVAIVLLNRPDQRNPLGRAFSEKMLRILDDLERDQEVFAIVLSGNGPAFCAGAEVGEVVSVEPMDIEFQFRLVRDFNKVSTRLRQLELPVIAAVNGVSVGGGAALALACDIIIGAEEASLYFAFGRIGACGADMGCAYTLPRLVGSMRARYLMLTGAHVKADEAEKLGIFLEVLPRDALLARAEEIARQVISANPRRAAAATKMALVRGEETSWEVSLAYEGYVQSYLFQTEDHHSRLSAFVKGKG